MKKLPTCSLLISTYNWPQALEACLKSVIKQTIKPNEILIADDGSTEETTQLINNFKSKTNIPITHVWHEDNGFRKTIVLNMALAKAKFEYIVQVDGDVYLHKDFIKDHLNFAKPNTFVRASRIYMDKNLSEKNLNNEFKISLFDKSLTNKFSALRIPFVQFLFEHKYKTKGNELYEIHGCNMAFWKADFYKVNGFNEDFNGWGPEDKELVVRLLNAGVKKRFLKMKGLVYHFWHKEQSRNNLQNNEDLLAKAIETKSVYCNNGLNKYLK